MLKTTKKVVDLRTLIELPDNPHYMTESEFELLKENIKEDGGTGTRPIVGWLMHDDDTQRPTAGILILMGNHRKRACVEVGLVKQEIILITDYLPPEKRWHLALRDNNQHGDDDIEKTAEAYKKINSPRLKSLTGLTDKKLGLLKAEGKVSNTPPGLLYNVIALTFAPAQLELALAALEKAKERVKASTTLMVAYADYDMIMDALAAVKRKKGIQNIAAQLMYIIEVFLRHADDE